MRPSAIGAVSTKSHITDLVTAADKAAEKLIVDRIHAARPDDGIIGEEGSAINPSAPIQWVIDPLDGTTNYVFACGPFAVSIGVELEGVPIVGVIHIPLTGETFSAAVGCGAFCNGERVLASDVTDLRQVKLAFDGRGGEVRAGQLLAAARLSSELADVRRIGSAACELAWAADGRFEATWVREVGHWDVCAGIAIAREAGAWVGSSTGGEPSSVDTLVAAPGIAEALLSALKV